MYVKEKKKKETLSSNKKKKPYWCTLKTQNLQTCKNEKEGVTKPQWYAPNRNKGDM